MAGLAARFCWNTQPIQDLKQRGDPSLVLGLIRRMPFLPSPGRRQFDGHTLMTLRVIRLAQAAGFTLDEIKSLRECAARERRSSRVWKTFVKGKQVEIQKRIAALHDMERTLVKLGNCTCVSFAACIRRLPGV